MDPFTKDLIDVIAQITGVVSVFFGIGVAVWQIKKYREEKAAQIAVEKEQREREIGEIKRNTAINRARFWLELRRMMQEHNEIHFALRNGDPLGAPDLPKIEAYMGLFEHVYDMLANDLIDWTTFKRVYGYRIDNIMANKFIVQSKLIDNASGWEAFIKLIDKMGYRWDGKRFIDQATG